MTAQKKPKPRRVKWSVGAAPADGKIVETLPLDEINALPKLSATLIEFAEPILSLFPDPPDRKHVEMAMVYAMVAWNLPLLEQAGRSSEITELWRETAPNIPPPVLAVIEGMMHARRTTYRHDPRIANVEVRDGADGQVSVHAESSLVSGGKPDLG